MSPLPHQFHMKDWKETTFSEEPKGTKVSRVEAAFEYTGDFAGKTAVFYVMRYLPDGTGHYEGWESFSGTWKGAAGEILLRHRGTFSKSGVDENVETEPATGTGALSGFHASWKSTLTGHGPYPIHLEVKN